MHDFNRSQILDFINKGCFSKRSIFYILVYNNSYGNLSSKEGESLFCNSLLESDTLKWDGPSPDTYIHAHTQTHTYTQCK